MFDRNRLAPVCCALLLGIAACTDSGVVGITLQQVSAGASAVESQAVSPSTMAPTMLSPMASRCAEDCAAMHQVCDPMRRLCVGCLANQDCAHMPGPPICDPVVSMCVDCMAPSDCPPSSPLCMAGECRRCAEPRDREGDCRPEPRCLGKGCPRLPGQRGPDPQPDPRGGPPGSPGP